MTCGSAFSRANGSRSLSRQGRRTRRSVVRVVGVVGVVTQSILSRRARRFTSGGVRRRGGCSGCSGTAGCRAAAQRRSFAPLEHAVFDWERALAGKVSRGRAERACLQPRPTKIRSVRPAGRDYLSPRRRLAAPRDEIPGSDFVTASSKPNLATGRTRRLPLGQRLTVRLAARLAGALVAVALLAVVLVAVRFAAARVVA